VQVTTARSQLKSVFRKVGVNRQQDLVRLLASLRASQ
jgi:DNA-binding CsgD family transcriptional regulator